MEAKKISIDGAFYCSVASLDCETDQDAFQSLDKVSSYIEKELQKIMDKHARHFNVTIEVVGAESDS